VATLRFFKTGFAAVLVLPLLFGAFMTFKLWPFGAEVPLLKTPEWKDKNIGELNTGRLQLRRETETEGALLLKRVALETVYRYDAQARTLNAVTDTEWVKARGPIANCPEQQAKPDRIRIRIDGDTHKLLIGEQEVSTAGGVALGSLGSPSGNWVAALSATGPIVPTLTLLNGGRVLGHRYHEIRSVPNGNSAGSSIQIPVVNTVTSLELCWSADESFVVYNDVEFSSLVVVETNLRSPDR
jgi:hypothetical protein